MFALRVYLPIIIALFLLFLLLFAPKVKAPATTTAAPVGASLGIQVGIMGVNLPLDLWLRRVWLLRLSTIVVSAALLIFAVSVDPSEYFPHRLRMDVYFDEEGIARELQKLNSNSELRHEINEQWRELLSEYDSEVKRSLAILWAHNQQASFPDTQDFRRALLHARGETTFIVERVGILAWRVTESRGRLDFNLDVPHKIPGRFTTLFSLRESPSNHIRPNLWKLVLSPAVTVSPEFRQILAATAGDQNSPFDHIVVGMTRITLLPFPAFSNTLYLWRRVGGDHVPIGYAVYY